MKKIFIVIGSLVILTAFGYLYREYRVVADIQSKLLLDKQLVETELEKVSLELASLKNEDQRLINQELQAEIENIERVYAEASSLFNRRADLIVTLGRVSAVDKEMAVFLKLLGEKKWDEADAQASRVSEEIEKVVLANTPKVTSPAITTATPSNELPGEGYSRQRVSTEVGEFVISMVSATGARVVVETASDSDCSDNCPTKSLAEHVSASGGFAGINGSYFCPPDYSQCQGKVNTFDTLAVNGRTKAVLNRENNVYSVVPLVVSNGSSLSFYDQTLQWGINQGGGGALANYPRLIRDGNITTTDNSSKGLRGFIGQRGSTIVIGHVHSASFSDTAHVLKTLGIENALNLDGGGSAALWAAGYRVGPGRSLPTAIVLVR